MVTSGVAGTPARINLAMDIHAGFYAMRSMLDAVVADSPMDFLQWHGLNILNNLGGPPIDRETLIRRIAENQRIADGPARAAVDALVSSGILAPDGPTDLAMTDVGRGIFRPLRAKADGIGAKIYDGIPEEDIAVTRQVLAQLIERFKAAAAGLRRSE